MTEFVEHEITAASVTFDHNMFDGSLTMRIHDADGDGGTYVTHVVHLPIELAIEFGGQAALHAGYIASSAISSALIGHCSTCKNTRLVDTVTPAGRPTNARCPDCGSRFDNPQPVPTLQTALDQEGAD